MWGAERVNMAPSKMESECRLIAAESFKCQEEHTKADAKVQTHIKYELS